MIDEDGCCQYLAGPGPSPFAVSMLGWQDGPTSGMAHCRKCGRAYHFELVAWDSEHDLRVFGLQEISKVAYDEVIALLSLPAPPPEQARERGDAVMLRVRDALATSFERTLYVAAIDLGQEVMGARRMTFSSWATLLGLDPAA